MAFNGVGPVIFESVSSVTATPSVELGSRLEKDGKLYVYVYNAGNSQAIPGLGVTVTGLSGYSVTISSTTMVDAFVGCVHHATLTTGTYGWVVARGNSKVRAHADTGIVAGNILTAGGDGVWTPNSVVTNATSVYPQAKATVTTISAGVGEAYVQCLYA